MKRITTPKLSLARETLRKLTAVELTVVVGGTSGLYQYSRACVAIQTQGANTNTCTGVITDPVPWIPAKG